MKSLFHIGLAMLVFAVALSLCPAAQAWQSGRWTRDSEASIVQQQVLSRAVFRQSDRQARRSRRSVS